MKSTNYRKKIKNIFSSKKIIFICIFYSIMLFTNVIDKIKNRIDLSSFNILGQTITLSELVGSEITQIIDSVCKVLFILNLVGLVPLLISVISIWLIKLGAKRTYEGSKRALIGLNWFKINSFIQCVIAILTCFIIGLGAILLVAFSSKLLSSVEINSGIVIGIIVLIAFILLIFFIMKFKYYSKFLVMLVGVSNTIRTNINFVQFDKFVNVISWIYGISTIISSVFSGKEITGIVAGICQGITVILVMQCFKEYGLLCGFASVDEIKEIYTIHLKDKQNYQIAEVIGINPNNETKKMSIIKYLFGTTVINEDIELNKNLIRETKIEDETGQLEIGKSTAASYNMSNKNQESVFSVKIVSHEKNFNETAPLLNAKVLSLFSVNMDSLEPRYIIIGNKEYISEFKCPVKISQIQIIEDQVSEKRILRLKIVNQSTSVVNNIIFNILCMDNQMNTQGIIKNVCFNSLEGIVPDNNFDCNKGIIVPDTTTCGVIKINRVDFADGLDWDKGSSEIYFATNEKIDYDLNQLANKRLD